MGSLTQISDDSPFTLENIPFGVFSTKDDPTPRTATAIGDLAVDLRALSKAGFFSDGSVTDALSQVWETQPRYIYRRFEQAHLWFKEVEANSLNSQH